MKNISYESDLVITVISDHNPNVFYELAVRNAIEKTIILLNKKDDKKSPFDLQDKRTIQYCEECMSTHLSEDNAKNLENTKIQLKKQVKNAEKLAECFVELAKKDSEIASNVITAYIKEERRYVKTGR